jgi:hypothetical protein
VSCARADNAAQKQASKIVQTADSLAADMKIPFWLQSVLRPGASGKIGNYRFFFGFAVGK